MESLDLDLQPSWSKVGIQSSLPFTIGTRQIAIKHAKRKLKLDGQGWMSQGTDLRLGFR